MPAPAPPPGYVTRHGAAKILGCFMQKVTAMIKRGELTAYELDGVVLVKETDVAAIAARTPRPLTPDEVQSLND
ncbi:helix-turn-helix domain-containing protein, partial [Mycobacterium sp. 155]|uniref:helix-turn-helix domain-containing protein n=1 Tax=Mycobacterium sp. 155 TaxID=1157943 RepID=UPI0003A0987D